MQKLIHYKLRNKSNELFLFTRTHRSRFDSVHCRKWYFRFTHLSSECVLISSYFFNGPTTFHLNFYLCRLCAMNSGTIQQIIHFFKFDVYYVSSSSALFMHIFCISAEKVEKTYKRNILVDSDSYHIKVNSKLKYHLFYENGFPYFFSNNNNNLYRNALSNAFHSVSFVIVLHNIIFWHSNSFVCCLVSYGAHWRVSVYKCVSVVTIAGGKT